jgi:predicted Holliday junction resolvase-like endonuclease
MRRLNVTSLSQSLLAKKIDLESQWNKSYLEQGKLTTDMQWLDVELKEVKRQILQQDLEAARQENNLVLSEDEDPAFIAS